MRAVTLTHPADYEGWRSAARALASEGVPPSEVVWRVGDAPADLFTTEAPAAPSAAARFSVPKAFLELAETVVAHADPERFALLYTALTRVIADRGLLDDIADPLVHRLSAMARAVRRDMHKMRAFVRFRNVSVDDDERFVAWFEPEHHIVRPNTPFFVRRFANMRWSILTPQECVHWDTEAVAFTPGATRAEAPDGDDLEETWRTYYRSIFNPARLKVGAMLREMPKKYWRNMPETALVPELIAGAGGRTTAMIERTKKSVPAQAAEGVDPRNLTPGGLAKAPHPDQPLDFGGLPAADALARVAELARACTRCPLYGPATQMVFGEGPADAPLMLVGEVPGDQEDVAGHPFVGPAGKVLDKALVEAGIDRTTAYVTNAVKHFKFERRGKRRIHSKPDAGEIEACKWWIEQERKLVQPRLTVALGATAARSLMGKVVTISKTRGQPQQLPDGGECWITVHPSFLLRIEDPVAAEAEYGRFVADLSTVRERLEALA